MTEFLKTLLFLNIQGSVLIVVLLMSKGIIRKSFSGLWQRNLWLIAFVFMLLPVWKLVPVQSVEPILIPLEDVLVTEYEELLENQWSGEGEEEIETPQIDSDTLPVEERVNPMKVLPILWVMGVFVFLAFNFGSYFIYLAKMKKCSASLVNDSVFDDVKEMMNIKRKIRVRKVNISEPPLLTGCFFPVIYLPEREMDEDEKRMVFLHELMHFRHMDLPIKWFASVINAINWFNPLLYIAMRNLNEGCEIYCDESVTKGMDDEGKKAYMNTILNLVEKK